MKSNVIGILFVHPRGGLVQARRSRGLYPYLHLFLKYFEELELELRFCESCLEYKRAFLIPNFVSIPRMFYKR